MRPDQGPPPCTADPEAWFAGHLIGGHRSQIRTRQLLDRIEATKRICREDCPYLDACLTAALEYEEGSAYKRFGIWGGLEAHERHQLDQGVNA